MQQWSSSRCFTMSWHLGVRISWAGSLPSRPMGMEQVKTNNEQTPFADKGWVSWQGSRQASGHICTLGLLRGLMILPSPQSGRLLQVANG